MIAALVVASALASYQLFEVFAHSGAATYGALANDAFRQTKYPNGVTAGGGLGITVARVPGFYLAPEIDVDWLLATQTSFVGTFACMFGNEWERFRFALGPSASFLRVHDRESVLGGPYVDGVRMAGALGMRALLGLQLDRAFVGVQADGRFSDVLGAGASVRVGFTL